MNGEHISNKTCQVIETLVTYHLIVTALLSLILSKKIRAFPAHNIEFISITLFMAMVHSVVK